MKICRNILVTLSVALGVISCANEDLSMVETSQGTMSLNVEQIHPGAVRAVGNVGGTAAFPVVIYSQSTGNEVKSYERTDEIPDKVTLPVGKYYAYAHTPGRLEKVMDTPFYEGRDDFEILRNVNTISTVNCRMANGGITVNYTDEFKKTFSDCVVSVDDGSESVIVYYASDETAYVPVTYYLHYKERTKALYVNVSATTREKGFRSTMNFTLTKREATEQYDDDNEYFAGGDCIVIHCSPIDLETTEGSVVGIMVNANIQFSETEEDFEIDVEDFVPDSGEDDDTPGGDSNAITLELPDDMVVSSETDPSKGDTYIAAEHGIKSIQVKMMSTSAGMVESLTALAANNEGVDFMGGAEVVENQAMVNLFEELGQTLSVPVKGDKEYTFPIGNFFSLLSMFPGEHSFALTIADMENNVKNGVLKLTIEEP